MDLTGEVKRYAKATVRRILFEAIVQDIDKHRSELAAHQIRSESERAIRAMIALAESDKAVAVRLEDFDRDPLLFNVLNGTIDLRTQQLREHRREELLTKLAPVNFDPAATCSVWEKFLLEVLPDPELRRFVQRGVGYSLSGDVTEEVMFLLHGCGANGKSKFLEGLRYVFGDYSMATDAATFMVTKGQTVRNDLARLRGARFVTAVESDAGKRLSEALIKLFTGGDTVSARFLYSEHFEFSPNFKLWLATNHKPRVLGTDEAIWRRIRLIPFSITIPKELRDHKLAEKLKAESSGILNWCLAGFRDWQNKSLGEPDCVTAATAEYRESQDALGNFLATKTDLVPNGEARAAELYSLYAAWTEVNGEYQMRDRDFSSALVDRGFEKCRDTNGRFWRGISMRM
jgi:putative DNA primase/helicase